MAGHNAISTDEQRVAWLTQHCEFLVGREPNKRLIVTRMKKDGLISPKTYWVDVKLDGIIRAAKILWYREHNR